MELARVRPHADDDADRKAERPWVDLDAVADDHASLLEALHALGDRRRREADAPTELGHAQPRIALELFEQPTVDLVQQAAFVGERSASSYSQASRAKLLRSTLALP